MNTGADLKKALGWLAGQDPGAVDWTSFEERFPEFDYDRLIPLVEKAHPVEDVDVKPEGWQEKLWEKIKTSEGYGYRVLRHIPRDIKMMGYDIPKRVATGMLGQMVDPAGTLARRVGKEPLPTMMDVAPELGMGMAEFGKMAAEDVYSLLPGGPPARPPEVFAEHPILTLLGLKGMKAAVKGAPKLWTPERIRGGKYKFTKEVPPVAERPFRPEPRPPMVEIPKPEVVVEKPAPRVAPKRAVKEPWEMTRKEFLAQDWNYQEGLKTGRPTKEATQKAHAVSKKIAIGRHIGRIKEAQIEGKPIPPEVLKQYPGLAKAKKPAPGAEALRVQREMGERLKGKKPAEDIAKLEGDATTLHGGIPAVPLYNTFRQLRQSLANIGEMERYWNVKVGSKDVKIPYTGGALYTTFHKTVEGFMDLTPPGRWIKKMFWDTGPDAAGKQMIRETSGRIAQHKEEAYGLSKDLLRLPREDQVRLQENIRSIQNHPDLAKITGPIKDEIAYITAERIRLGQLVPGTIEGYMRHWNETYLKTMYRQKLAERTVGRLFRKGLTPSRVHKRGLRETVEPSRVPSWEGRGWRVDRTLKDGRVVMFKDIPEVRKLQLGEIKEAPPLVFQTLFDGWKNVEIGRLQEAILNDKTLWRMAPEPGFSTKPPGKWTVLPKELAHNFYLKDDVGAMMRSTLNQVSGLEKALRTIVWPFKTFKVTFNLPTQVRNTTSNMIFNELGGLPLERLDFYARAVSDIKTGSKFYKRFKVASGGRTWVEAELQNIITPKLENALLKAKTRGGVANVLSKIILGGQKTLGAPGNAYQFMETWAKYTKAKYNLEVLKMTEAAAIKDGIKWTFDYADVPPGIRVLRSSAIPFVTYPYKAFPRLLEVAMKHPIRMGKWYLIYRLVKKAMGWHTGVTEEEFDTALEASRDYIKNDPFPIPVGKREDGSVEILPLGWHTPIGGMAPLDERSGELGARIAAKIPPPLKYFMPIDVITQLQPGPFGIPFEIALNKKLWGGYQIKQPSEPMGKYLQYAATQYGPPWIGYQGRELTHIGKPAPFSGEVRPPEQVLLHRILGLNIRPASVGRGTRDWVKWRNTRLRELKEEEGWIRAKYRRSTDPKDRQRMVDELERVREKRLKIIRQFQEKISKFREVTK